MGHIKIYFTACISKSFRTKFVRKMDPSIIIVIELENRIKALEANAVRADHENKRKERIINKLHLEKNALKKKLRKYGGRKKREGNKYKELKIVNKKLTMKVRKLGKNGTDREITKCKDTDSKGKEKMNTSMKKIETMLNEKEMLIPKLCECKKAFEVREGRLK